eukprot:TRINITY_DN3284_c0_g1_i1.p1 TRINITY_DN3284_c0_g1~~TRINITY_DN3284_c0_g1_i1.p1  ORF type:complete len:376 (-),score=63.23 TRINITY_DN3284_c0_g1_i1:504-1568(-)
MQSQTLSKEGTITLPTFWSQKISSQRSIISPEDGEHIAVTQIVLGETAKPGQPVQVFIQWQGLVSSKPQKTVLCTLERGRVDQVNTDVKVFDEVSVTHTGGKDVEVYMNGTQYISLAESDDEEQDGEAANAKQQQGTAIKIERSAKQEKVNKEELSLDVDSKDEDEDDEDEEDEEEEEEEAPKLVKIKVEKQEQKADIKKAKKEIATPTGKVDGHSQQTPQKKKDKKQVNKEPQVSPKLETKQSEKQEGTPKQQKGKVEKRKIGEDASQHTGEASHKKQKQDTKGGSAASGPEEEYKQNIIKFLQEHGGKAQIGELGLVQKPKSLSKKIKPGKIIRSNVEIFNFNASDNIVSLR